uniref:Uncharacterized protein n=1 Tax=Knipowitschia caucasica TaxID=637954 RepID=A0AAV2K5J8_KNICA
MGNSKKVDVQVTLSQPSARSAGRFCRRTFELLYFTERRGPPSSASKRFCSNSPSLKPEHFTPASATKHRIPT